MKTILHTYSFNTNNADEKKDYQELVKDLKATKGRGHWLNCWGPQTKDRKRIEAGEVTLETAHLFSNQWNTDTMRVFDWYEEYNIEDKIKRGYYLDITKEMIDVRNYTSNCGWCGKQEPSAKGYLFCPHCIGSEYLTEDKLHLTRMMPVANDSPSLRRANLSEIETAILLPLWKESQIGGKSERGLARTKKVRDQLTELYNENSEKNEVTYQGKMWWLDQGFELDNLIYYSHTKVFTWGWRHLLTYAEVQKVLEVISEFQYDYCIKGLNEYGVSRDWKRGNH
jgi:hypothetical protein